jgi:hypothetical protein
VFSGSSDIRNDEDLMIISQQRWLVDVDNCSEVSRQMSDSFCRLSTGGTYARRKKYSDGDTSLFRAKRPVLMTSINDVITAGDLLDRTLRFELPPITERKSEILLRTEFAAARGRILGALLDGVSSALRNLAAVKVDQLRRLADFGLWATAAEQGLGLKAGAVMNGYRANRQETSGLILDNDLARAIQKIEGEFKGNALELAKTIGWSLENKDVSKMAVDLRGMAQALDEQGVSVTFGKSNGKRQITIKRAG